MPPFNNFEIPNNFDFGNQNFQSQPIQGGSGGSSGTGVDLTRSGDELFSHKDFEAKLNHRFYKKLMQDLDGDGIPDNQQGGRPQRPTPSGQFIGGGNRNPFDASGGTNPIRPMPPGQFPTFGGGQSQPGNMQQIIQQLMQVLNGGGQGQRPQQGPNIQSQPIRRPGLTMPTANNFLPMLMQQLLGTGGPQGIPRMNNAYNQSNQPGRLF